MSTAAKITRGLVFVALNVSIVGLYCFAMSGKVEPLKHEPTRFVTVPLMVVTAVVAVLLFPLLSRLGQRLPRAVMLYCGFVLISALYGIYLWTLFADGSPWTVLMTIIGGHLYGWPVFLLVIAAHLLTDRLLFPGVNHDARRGDS